MRKTSFKIRAFLIGMLLAILTIISFNTFGQSPSLIKLYEREEGMERYKLYPTENYNMFLKLDTRTGKSWQVQKPPHS